MSRPPRPSFRHSPAGDQPGSTDRLDYMRPEFSDFLELQTRLAGSEAGVEIPGESGDMTRTLLELPALLAHILSAYQDLYAGEAFLSTARSPKSLIRHARRLAYEPDAGLAATGYEVLYIKEGLSGRIPEGFAFSSTPFGEDPPQTFETLNSLDVNADWNEMRPVNAQFRPGLTFKAQSGRLETIIYLKGVGLNLVQGGIALLSGFHNSPTSWPFVIGLVQEIEERKETEVSVWTPTDSADGIIYRVAVTEQDSLTLLTDPEAPLRVFGWDADPVQFPPDEVANPRVFDALALAVSNTSVNVGDTAYGYEFQGAGANLGKELFLSVSVDEPLESPMVLAGPDGSLTACRIDSASEVNVAFRRGEVIGFEAPSQITTSEDSGVKITTVTMTTRKQTVFASISQSVTALKMINMEDSSDLQWNAANPFPVNARLYWKWKRSLPLTSRRPNHTEVNAESGLELDVSLDGMRPGRTLIFSDMAETRTVTVELTRFVLKESSTRIFWKPSAPGWYLDNLKVYGNVARISHGETVSEVLGGSDGITPYQRFPLKKSPVTQTPGAAGGELNLKVRVDDILWRRVDDFHDSGPQDRIYRVERSEDHEVTVLFGGEGKGAVPPAGKKNITCEYRKGLGREGNVGSGRVSRIKKAAPILERAANPLNTGGGTPPAAPEDIRTQATRYIRTFDRAVSVADYADLALLFEGVARASARWNGEGSVELTAATADGDPIEAGDALRKFLDQRRDTTIGLILLDPMATAISVTIQVTSDAAYLPENIKICIQNALYAQDDDLPPGSFTFRARQLGEAAFLSHLYATVEGVEGVKAVRITRFCLKGRSDVFDVIRATSRQWLSLSAQDCDITVTPESPESGEGS